MQKVRLIDANALFNDLKESAKSAREWREETQDEEIKIRAEQAHGTFIECALRVRNAPTIEAEPVRHGRWIEAAKHRDENGTILTDYECSECFAMVKDSDAEEIESERFCYNCGARMNGDHIADDSKKVGGADNG